MNEKVLNPLIQGMPPNFNERTLTAVLKSQGSEPALHLVEKLRVTLPGPVRLLIALSKFPGPTPNELTQIKKEYRKMLETTTYQEPTRKVIGKAVGIEYVRHQRKIYNTIRKAQIPISAIADALVANQGFNPGILAGMRAVNTWPEEIIGLVKGLIEIGELTVTSAIDVIAFNYEHAVASPHYLRDLQEIVMNGDSSNTVIIADIMYGNKMEQKDEWVRHRNFCWGATRSTGESLAVQTLIGVGRRRRHTYVANLLLSKQDDTLRVPLPFEEF